MAELDSSGGPHRCIRIWSRSGAARFCSHSYSSPMECAATESGLRPVRGGTMAGVGESATPIDSLLRLDVAAVALVSTDVAHRPVRLEVDRCSPGRGRRVEVR